MTLAASTLASTLAGATLAGSTPVPMRAASTLATVTLAAWTPEASYDSGTAWRIAVDASYPVHPALKASATVGRRWVEAGVDRTFWDAGITGTWNKLALDLRYVDTNLDERECGFTQRCSATIVATLTLRFW